MQHWDGFYKWLYMFADCLHCCDEIFGVMPDGRAPHYLKAVLTRGRSLRITFIGGTQRPYSVPMALLTESEHRFMFALSMLDDKKRMAELMPGTVTVNGKEVPKVLTPLGGEHNFYYYYVRGRELTREFHLSIRRENKTPENARQTA